MGLVNSSALEPARVRIDLAAPARVEAARVFRIHGPSLEAINVPGRPEAVTLGELPAEPWTGALDLPAPSISLVRLLLAE